MAIVATAVSVATPADRFAPPLWADDDPARSGRHATAASGPASGSGASRSWSASPTRGGAGGRYGGPKGILQNLCSGCALGPLHLVMRG